MKTKQNQTIAVVGATGKQGGGLVRAILSDEISRALNPSLQTFDAWIARNANRIPLEEP